jgi:hypothetical protein
MVPSPFPPKNESFCGYALPYINDAFKCIYCSPLSWSCVRVSTQFLLFGIAVLGVIVDVKIKFTLKQAMKT